jgi:hypothetical protein
MCCGSVNSRLNQARPHVHPQNKTKSRASDSEERTLENFCDPAEGALDKISKGTVSFVDMYWSVKIGRF